MNDYYGYHPWQGGYYPPGYPSAPYYGNPWGWEYDWYDYNANAVLDDDEITDLVRDTIDSNPYISRSDKEKISIKVENGIVSLSGEVKNRRSKPLAYADAFWSAGVVDVNSDIKVKPRQQKKEK